jgi:uncharacterized SAM-binding protein YcdF (DUF218 family)
LLVTVKMLLGELLMPPTSLLAIALLGFILIKRRPLLGRTLALASLALLWLLSTPVVALWLYRLDEAYPSLDLRRPLSAGAIVILGGGGARMYAPEWGGPMPSDQLWDRLTYGAALARHTGLPLLITDNGYTIRAMRNGLERALGVRPRWIDDAARDTYENARNSARILRAAGIDRVILVTHSVHMRRSVAEFEAAGLAVVPAPVATRLTANVSYFQAYLPDPNSLAYARMVVHEFIGTAVGGTLRTVRGRQ